MKSIFRFTLIYAARNRYLQVAALILLIGFILTAINSVFIFKTQQAQFDEAKESVRKAWLNQGEQNPHSSAHYGHYVFRPVYGVQLLDKGINPFAGSILQLEGHVQHDPKFSPSENRTESSRFQDFSFSWMLQVLIPLFIVLLCFNAVSADKEQLNLKLLAAQGLSKKAYLAGKVSAHFFIILAIVTIGFLIQWVALAIGANQLFTAQDWTHTALWLISYLLFFLIVTGISVMASSWLGSSKSSLLTQIVVWMFWIMIMPKLTANLGATMYPVEQRTAFNTSLREDRQKGIDGHNPSDERSKQFKDSLLKHYDTEKINDLPINADGLIMQADEEYANQVYDKHFTRIRHTIHQQNSISKYAALVNPFFAIRNISMGLAQSDYHHYLQFVANAEQYRRYLIHKLNTALAYGGSKTGEWDWKVKEDYWQTVDDFSYERPSIQSSMQNYQWEAAMLGCWLLLSIALFFITAKRLQII